MEYRWRIYGGKAVKLRIFLHVKAYIHEVKNQDREKRKIPHRQGIHEELLEVWEDLVHEIYSWYITQKDFSSLFLIMKLAFCRGIAIMTGAFLKRKNAPFKSCP